MKCSGVIVLLLYTTASNNQLLAQHTNTLTITPSYLLQHNGADLQAYTSLYTQAKEQAHNTISSIPRSNYSTTLVQLIYGVSKRVHINAGLIVEYKSNTFNSNNILSPYNLKATTTQARNGFTYICPTVKWKLNTHKHNAIIQSTVHIPTFGQERNNNGYLSQKSIIVENKLLRDYATRYNKLQVFTSIGTRVFLGKRVSSYANNSVELAPSIFFNYQAVPRLTTLLSVQNAVLIPINNKISQYYTSVGIGAKYAISQYLQVEVLANKFVLGLATGLGSSMLLGVRYVR